MLAPWARVAGYGAYRLSPKRAAALALRGPESAASWSKAVVFPPDGSSFDIGRMYEIEWPNPLSACPGYAIPVGLPLSVQTGRAIQAQAASVKDLTTGENLEVCTIDAFNYSNPDPAEQAHGRNLLQYNAAVVVIPKHPLTPGDRYAVDIHTLKHEFAWSFSIAPSAQENAPSPPGPVHKAAHHLHPTTPMASPTPPMSGTSRVWRFLRECAAMISPHPEAIAATLEQHRDHHFRRMPSRRIGGASAALRFIEESGFCTAFTPGLGVPCLREAIEGRREPELPHHIQHDHAVMMTWRLKDELPARRAVYYGKVIGGRPGFVALELLPAFFRLRIAPGGYKKLYERGELSHCAKLVMDALSRRGAAETKAMKLTCGYSQPKHRADFDRAMKELQEKFLALKVEERYDPFTYVWDTVEHRWSEELHAARSLTPRAAAYQIVRRYFVIAGYGNERAVARMLGIGTDLVGAAVTKLEREKVLVRNQRIAGIRESVTLLSNFLSS